MAKKYFYTKANFFFTKAVLLPLLLISNIFLRFGRLLIFQTNLYINSFCESDMNLQQLRMKILQLLYTKGARDALDAIDSEDMARYLGLPWDNIRDEVAFLQSKKYIELRSRQIGTRVFHAIHITSEGVEVTEGSIIDMSVGSPPPAVPPASPESIPLTLRLVPQGDTVQITWEADVLGRRASSFRSPFDATTLPLAIKALDAVQWPYHPDQGPKFDQSERERLTALGYWSGNRVAKDVHERIGRALYDALVADPEGATALRTARDHATERGLPLAYLLRFPPGATDLAALPWELLCDTNGAVLLSRGKRASCVRYLDLAQALPPPSPPGSVLRILALAPIAHIPAHVRADERTARNTAWADLEKSSAVALEELSPVTRDGLVDRIQNGPPVDIIHFYGHGRYKSGEGALLLDTPGGGESWVSADRLAALLGDARLIALYGCQSAMIGEAGLLTGVATALSAAGVPAVVAMQLTMPISAATRFAEVFYRRLARGDSVQRAVDQARQALYVENDGASWYVPTLTIRARDLGPLRLVQKS